MSEREVTIRTAVVTYFPMFIAVLSLVTSIYNGYLNGKFVDIIQRNFGRTEYLRTCKEIIDAYFQVKFRAGGGDQLSSSLQHVKAGALKALAVTTRSAALPDVPSARELGFPNLDLRGWNGFFAPKGTPEPVIARLHQEIAAAAKNPEVQQRMLDVGAEPSGSSQAEMRDMLREQIAKVRPMVEELKLVVQ
jgi:tripartite-type tricarboxylate transporter receptor subunit TctC